MQHLTKYVASIKQYFSKLLQKPKVILSPILHQTFFLREKGRIEGLMLHLSLMLDIHPNKI